MNRAQKKAHEQLTHLMVNPPAIKSVAAPSEDEWVVSVYGVASERFRPVTRPLPLREALHVLRERLNLHVVAIHELMITVYGEE